MITYALSAVVVVTAGARRPVISLERCTCGDAPAPSRLTRRFVEPSLPGVGQMRGGREPQTGEGREPLLRGHCVANRLEKPERSEPGQREHRQDEPKEAAVQREVAARVDRNERQQLADADCDHEASGQRRGRKSSEPGCPPARDPGGTREQRTS